jgi:hypothetical protein
MPLFYRASRRIQRLFFALVLVMALFGGCYAQRNWAPQPEDLALPSLSADTDWTETASNVLEDAIQIFLGMTGGQ